MNTFDQTLENHQLPALSRASLKVLQLNITRTCNMACHHCHVESSPKRSESMSRAVMQRIIAIAEQNDFEYIDITGGAPEIHPDFRWFISQLHATGTAIQVRTNLTIHTLPEHAGCLEFLAEHQVHLVASLPCYLEDNVEAQRGKGVFNPSIDILQKLNALGYGKQPKLPLHLVYNPSGTGLPGGQAELEKAYRQQLRQRYGIEFTGLFTITNMPLGRFAQDLARQDQLAQYMDKLEYAFNPSTLDGLMCRHQIEVDYDGSIYDCDFNLALNLTATPASIMDIEPKDLLGKKIVTAAHCLGCTAGSGSSCGGAIVDQQANQKANEETCAEASANTCS